MRKLAVFLGGYLFVFSLTHHRLFRPWQWQLQARAPPVVAGTTQRRRRRRVKLAPLAVYGESAAAPVVWLKRGIIIHFMVKLRNVVKQINCTIEVKFVRIFFILFKGKLHSSEWCSPAFDICKSTSPLRLDATQTRWKIPKVRICQKQGWTRPELKYWPFWIVSNFKRSLNILVVSIIAQLYKNLEKINVFCTSAQRLRYQNDRKKFPLRSS